MNTIKLISAAAIAAVATASCSRSDEPVTGNDRVEVRFSASTAEIQTRVADNSWTANDPVGIYMIGASGTLETDNIVEDAGNRQYTAAAGAGPVSFTPADAAATIYYPMSGDVEFIAYYPYESSLTDFKLPVDVSNQTNQSAIDVLYAPKTSGAYSKSKKDDPVDLQFTHKLVKLAFDITAGDGVIESLDGLTAKITNQQTEATLNLTDGTVTATGAASAITANIAPDGSSSEAIVLPAGSVSGMTFTFTTAAGGVYEVDVPAGSWASGKKYTYEVTLKRNEAGISGTVSNWGNGGSNIPVIATPEVQIVLIPGGTFLMGSSASEPNRETNETQHTVTLTRDYYMSRYPITNAQYAGFLNHAGVDATGVKADIIAI